MLALFTLLMEALFYGGFINRHLEIRGTNIQKMA